MHDEEYDVEMRERLGDSNELLWTALNLGTLEMLSQWWREKILFCRIVVFDGRQNECSSWEKMEWNMETHEGRTWDFISG